MLSVAYKKDSGRKGKTESGILKMLAYFSIFEYPLTSEEIKGFLPPDAHLTLVNDSLDQLLAEQLIFKIDGFYSLQDDASLVQKRKEGNLRAGQLLPKGMKNGQFLFKFPYVRGIAISGSLSKMYADEKSDIDFFIVTKANRLWIARTFMHLFKKLTFLRGTQHFYCMNYYIDEKALLLEDRNIYTAIETITLLPVRGEGLRDFFIANDWVQNWFGQYDAKQKEQFDPGQHSWVKKTVEWIFNNKFGDWLDNYLMKKTTRRWNKKKQKGSLNHEGKVMGLLTGKHFAKSNPAQFQEKLLKLYNEKVSALNIE